VNVGRFSVDLHRHPGRRAGIHRKAQPSTMDCKVHFGKMDREDSMATTLRNFSQDEILITKNEAWSILRFFWSNHRIQETEITYGDMNFAQGLLVEAIDASYKMGFVEIIFNNAFLKVPGSFSDVKKMIKKIVKESTKHWFKNIGKNKLDDATIYVAVRDRIALNFRSVMAIRMQTGSY
jgi:hypothetical protein